MATDFAVSLRRFLTGHLAGLRGYSTNTIVSYRDAFKLLICYFRDQRHVPPERLTLELIDAAAVTGFLDWLRTSRGNSPSTSNQRLAAIDSFFTWMQTQDPARMACCQDILAIPASKHDRPAVAHLTVDQTRHLLAAPDRSTHNGRRDATLLATLYDTAARVQELADLTVRDIRLDHPAMAALTGKGAKPGTSRSTPTPPRCWPPTSPSSISTAQATGTTRCSSTSTGPGSAAAGSPGSFAHTRTEQQIRRSSAPT
ncbi:MAG: integrase/recombinase XerD [Sphingomonadales bacterium]|nr:integrase/recombinase XerD [Sphingomonadales bacterium]